MNLFKSFKDKKKPNSDIIASIEEEDILYEEELENQKAVEPVEPVQEKAEPKEEPVEEKVEEPVEEPAEEPTEEVEEPVEEQQEETTEEEQQEEPTEEEPVEETEEQVEEQVEETEEPQEEEEPVEEPTEEIEEIEEPVEEQQEEIIEEPTEEVEEIVEEEPVEPIEEVAEEPQEETAEEIEVVAEEPIEESIDLAFIPDVNESQETVEEIPKEPVYQPTFAEKMNIADEDIQRRYDELKNYALRFKKLTWRISKKYDSINQGRFQFVKLSVAGKTLKLNLNMEIGQCDPKYHCVDKSATKTYEEVPVQMRVKSDRGLKYAKELIDQCAQMHGLIENPKFKQVDSLELVRQHLELGNTDDIIIETQDFDDEE